MHFSSQRISERKKQDCHHNAWDAVKTPSKHINLTDFKNADHLNHPSFRYLFLEMRDIANQKARLSQVLLAFYVGTLGYPTPVWSTGLLRVFQDLNLLNASLLIPTWFPVEPSWLILAQTLYMELEAPPVPRTPLCCIFPGPRGPMITTSNAMTSCCLENQTNDINNDDDDDDEQRWWWWWWQQWE